MKWEGLAWEIDPDLVAFSSKQFPNMEHRGDIDSDEPSAVVERLRQLDPACKATVIIAAGPPCPDHSRIRSDAPGSQGSEGPSSSASRTLSRSWRLRGTTRSPL